MGGSAMLIQVTGRKSGRLVQLPVNFHRRGSDLWVLSSRERVWWRNLRENPAATLWISGQQVAARAELVLDETAVQYGLDWLCTSKSCYSDF